MTTEAELRRFALDRLQGLLAEAARPTDPVRRAQALGVATHTVRLIRRMAPGHPALDGVLGDLGRLRAQLRAPLRRLGLALPRMPRPRQRTPR